MPKIYIAGPMTGFAQFNFPAFFAAEAKFRALGYTVFNPANRGDAKAAIDGGFDFIEAYLWDIHKVMTSDAIYMLKGWENSPGACGEHACAVAKRRHYPKFKIIYQDNEELTDAA